ncbi:OsmC family protein [Marinobacter maritimus]|uniref:OsmC family protein n=1 Tax=Marinobacter maritimus TaxID=277961 RepID=UPI0011A3BCD0|nr:OsmC family protein [Marinobacter maritimus]
MTNTAIKTDHIVNGIDTARIVELATKMSQDDSYGNFRFRADNEWVNGNLSRTAIKDFYAGNDERTERAHALIVAADQPAFLAGDNTAPNAVEHYLNSLVSCITTTVVAHASVQGFAIQAFNASAEGEMDARGFFGVSDDANRGFSKVRVNVKAKTSADEATVRKLMSYSPVYELVSKAIPVDVHITVEQLTRA